MSERRKISMEDYAAEAPYALYEWEDRRFDPENEPLKRRLYEFGDFDEQPWKNELHRRLRLLSKHKLRRVLQPIGIFRAADKSISVVMEHQAERLSAQLTKSGLNDADAVSSIFTQVAEGLAELHRLKIPHGDIRPETIEYDPISKSAWIADAPWGPMAHWLGGGNPRQNAAHYLPPEFVGKFEPATATGDIYALGKLVQQLLTGSAADNASLASDSTRIAEIPLSKLLAKNPSDRPADGASVLDCVRAAGSRHSRRRAAIYSLAGLLACVVLTFLIQHLVSIKPLQEQLAAAQKGDERKSSSIEPSNDRKTVEAAKTHEPMKPQPQSSSDPKKGEPAKPAAEPVPANQARLANAQAEAESKARKAEAEVQA